MPNYLYKCECGKEQTHNVSIDMRENTVCICECGRSAVRQITVPNFSLKGVGWTTTDKLNKGFNKNLEKEVGNLCKKEGVECE